MTTTRFKLPPVAKAAPGFDHWVTGKTEPSSAASRGAAAAMAGKTDVKASFMPDVTGVFAAYWRNVEALTAANKIAFEGARAVARGNLEFLRRTTADLSEQMWAMTGPEPIKERAVRQGEMVIDVCDQAAANMRDLGDIIQHAHTEAVQVLNKRVADAVDEVNALARGAVRGCLDTEFKLTPTLCRFDWMT
ncbi:MAG: phasin family protein [Acetobacteraceae bacterium]|jgi:phasin family protein